MLEFSELIEEEKKEWKTDMVKQIFNKDEPAQICNIPITKMGIKHKLIWASSKEGLFSVKSTYHMA